MKKIVIVLVSCMLLLACSDVVDFSQTKEVISNDPLKNANGISTLDIGPVNPYVWTKLPVPLLSDYFEYYPRNDASQDLFLLEVNNEVYCGIASHAEVAFKFNKATKRWDLFDDPNGMFTLTAIAGYKYLFSYDSKFYAGLRLGDGDDAGGEDESYIGSHDVVTGDHQEKARFPGTPVSEPACFVVGSKGYIIGGYNPRTKSAVNQFWEYDFIADQWTNKGSLPGGARAGASAYVLNNKVYFGLGYDVVTINGQRVTRYKKDWYQMDPASSGGIAMAKTTFPGTPKKNPKGFTINEKFYLGWAKANDFWEYNPASNKWTQKDNLPVAGSSDRNVSLFAVGNAGYLVQGWMGTFWRYSNTTLVPVP